MRTLTGKMAVITGVSRQMGIGAAIARTLAEMGCAIYTTYYRPYDATMPWGSAADEAEAILADLRQLGVPAHGMELDLSQPDVAPRLFDAAETAVGPIHILVNNAAYSTHTPITTLTAAELDAHYAVNVRGMALLCAEFVRRHTNGWAPTNRWGRIINLTSGQSAGPMPGELAYVASKGAVEAFTVTLAAEIAAQGITVNAIDPGITDTGWIPPDLLAHFVAQAPMGRVGTPQDAAQLVGFLASPAAGWITGQIMRSRGGL